MMPAMSSREKYNEPDPAKLLFAIVPVVSPPSNAIMHGPLNAVMAGVSDSALIRQTRNDAVSALNDAVTKMAQVDQREAELNKRDQQLTTRELALNAATRNVVDFAGRLSELYDRMEQQRNDQLEGPLPLPPGMRDAEQPTELRTNEPPAATKSALLGVRDEGELESPKLAKDPEEQDPEFDDQAGYETEFPSPGDPDLPEPLPRDPRGDNK
jgi:hypothetical protein